MKISRKTTLLAGFLLGLILPLAAQVRTTREEYIDRYKSIAIAQMERYGIPARITLAQGILESDCGNSLLSMRSNNHFGIKCKRDWTGEKVYHDDDAKGECFRSYPSVEASYRDHAEFLDSQPRYDSLFAYAHDDYRSWARGLKAAGYATAPDYAQRLIRIIEENELPIKCCAYSACFRREAGSYGKDVRGLNRLHQFDKVEIVRIDTPQHAEVSYQEMLDHVEGLLAKLELPYHILRLCGGDMSFTSAICHDFEAWSAAQQRWLEVSSVSNFGSYQANRLHCRFRHADTKKIELCHTLNGSALALPRIMAALLENNQTPEGIKVPECLQKYTGFSIID